MRAAEEKANKLLQLRGYIVIATYVEHKPRDVIGFLHGSSRAYPDHDLNFQFGVTQSTDYADWTQQCIMLELQPDEEGGRNFYRVVAE